MRNTELSGRIFTNIPLCRTLLRFLKSIFEGNGEDEADRSAKTSSAKSRSSSVPANRDRKTFSTPKPPTGRTVLTVELCL